MLVEEHSVRLLIDPGSFTVGEHQRLTNIDAVLITHEHEDHLHRDSLKVLLKTNPKATVLCSEGVAQILSRESIEHTALTDSQMHDIRGVSIEAFGALHAEVHSSLPLVKNVGFLIANHFWYPGDALNAFPKPPAVLALPISGPWLKLGDALEYALKIRPTGCFVVHEGLLNEAGLAIHTRIVKNVLEPRGIQVYDMEPRREYEY